MIIYNVIDMSEGQPAILQNVTNVASNAYTSATDSMAGFKNTVSSSMSEYSSPESLGKASSDFLQSNSIIARIAFILFVIILFNILLRLGMFLLNYFSQTKTNPYLIYGLIDGGRATMVTQDPTDDNSITLLRSNNKASGIEYTWSVWLFFNGVGTPDSVDGTTTGSIESNNIHFQHIFHKGTNSYGAEGTAILHNGPGVYLSRNSNPTIRILLDTVVSTEKPVQIDIDNIPLKKWFHLLIRLKNNSVDVYVNGIISAHVVLENVPKQTYYDVFICDNGGFNGSLSNLRYYASALDIFSIKSIVSAGPNLKPSTTQGINSATVPKYGPSYLSSLWYTKRV